MSHGCAGASLPVAFLRVGLPPPVQREAQPGGRQEGTLLRPGRAVRVKAVRGGRAHVRNSAGLSFTLDGRGQSDPQERDWQ